MADETKLRGEGETRTQVCRRRECEECEELAVVRETFLLPHARTNPASSAYRRDDCSWCSDAERWVCDTHKGAPSPEGFKRCSSYQASPRFAHMFLEWVAAPTTGTEGND